jgi:hypothetical protein
MNNWGGYREGAGRKTLATKAKLIESLDRYIDEEDVVKVLRTKVLEGDLRAIKLYLEMKYGKPSASVEVMATTHFKGIGFKDILKFE